MPGVSITTDPAIRERDFRSHEGRSFRKPEARTGGQSSTGSAPAESFEEMTARVNRFIDTRLDPIIASLGVQTEQSMIVVVAHGIILGVLWKALLSRFVQTSTPTETRPLWSNTGYLQATVYLHFPPNQANGTEQSHQLVLGEVLFNQTTHLQGLKKTRGGIGSAKFDEKQRTMDAFIISRKRKADAGDV